MQSPYSLNMINSILYENFENKKNRTAIVEGNYSATYSELCLLVNSLSGYLKNAGIKKGDKICLYLPNSAEFVIGFFAVTNIGAICVPISAKYKSGELRHYVSYSGAKLILTTSDLLEVAKDLNSDIQTVVVKGGGAGWEIGNNKEEKFELNDNTSQTDKAIYLFSTGSTGVPKCVARSHANLLALAENHTSTVGWDINDKILFVIPVSHTYAFGNLISSLKIGAAVYMLEDFNRKRVVKSILENNISIFPAVPFMLDVLSRYTPAKAFNFKNLKHVISAGAHLNESVAKEFNNCFGLFPRQLYGSSETGVISINMAEKIHDKLSSVGRPVKNVEVKIVDENNNSLKTNETGEIIVKSPSMTDRYENLPEESSKVFKDGYYYTGDLGRINQDGYIYITGRKKLFINISGQKVDPGEVENVILLNEFVSDVAVVGRKNSSGTEYVAAYIVSKKELKVSDIVKFCRDKISDIKIPTSIKFIDEIPRSPTGKILREKLD